MYDCDAAVLLNVYIYLVFAGRFLAQVPSHLPQLRTLCLKNCPDVRPEYVQKFLDAAPKLEIINRWGNMVRVILD